MFGLAEGSIALAILGYFGYLVKDIPGRIWGFILPRISYSVSFISTESAIYDVGVKWITNLNANILKRNKQFNFIKFSNKDEIIDSINYGTYLFFVDKFTIVYIDKYLMEKNENMQDRIYIRIFGFNQNKYINKLEQDMKDIYSDKDLCIKFTSKWSSCNVINKKRDINTIFSPEKDKIINIIDTWRNNKYLYEDNGIVYKLGILLYGEPGTGKSSMAKAIASYLNWDIECIDLNNSNANSLVQAITFSGRRKIVLFEDIDCSVAERTDPENNCFDALLNILDGALSPNEVIFIATTNYIDRLDPALIRDGRFDCKVQMNNLPIENAIEMCKSFKVDPSILDDEKFPINPSYLQNKLLSIIKN